MRLKRHSELGQISGVIFYRKAEKKASDSLFRRQRENINVKELIFYRVRYIENYNNLVKTTHTLKRFFDERLFRRQFTFIYCFIIFDQQVLMQL